MDPLTIAAVSGGVSLVQGILGSRSAKKAARAQAAAQAQQMAFLREQFAAEQKQLAENRRLADETLAQNLQIRQQQLGETKAAFEQISQQLAAARQEGDQIAAQNLQAQLNEITQNEQRLNTEIQQQRTEYDQMTREAQAREHELASTDWAANEALRLEGMSDTARAQSAIGNELSRIEGQGTKPEGLDAAFSDIDRETRNAGAEANRRAGGSAGGSVDLALAMNAIRSKGSVSAGMRQQHEQMRTGNIASLSSALSTGALARQNLQRTVGEREAALGAGYDAARIGAQQNAGAARLGVMGNTGAARLQGLTGFGAQQAGNAAAFHSGTMQNTQWQAGTNLGIQNAMAGDRSNALSAKLGMPLSANAANIASAYGTQAGLAHKQMLAGQESMNQAIGNIAGTIAGYLKPTAK
jgi:hypothetical protein